MQNYISYSLSSILLCPDMQYNLVFSEQLIDRVHAFPGNTRSVMQQVVGIVLFRSN